MLENYRQKRRGRLAWAALIIMPLISIVFIGASFYLILNNHPIIESVFSGGNFVIILGSLIDMVPKLLSKDDISYQQKIMA